MSMLVTKENKIMTGISYIQYQNKSSSNSVGSGAVCGIIGMSAYHLPVTKDRFVRSAYSIVKEQTEETLEQMNEAAVSAQKGRLSNEQKVFLAQNGVGETVAENILRLCLKDKPGEFISYEVGLPTAEGINLPCGCSAMYIGK